MTIQTLSTPSGETLVVMPLSDYEDLADARLHEAAMRGVEHGLIETFSSEQAARYLAAPSPLAFWREFRGFSVNALSERAGVDEVRLREAEAGFGTLDVHAYRRLAALLRVGIEDLIEQADEKRKVEGDVPPS